MRLRTKVQVYGMTDRIYIFVTLYCNCCDCHYFWPIIIEEMATAKPLLLPEVFSGEPQSWTEWLEHFESVAAINKWESAEEKMKWLKVRITGQARMVFRKFPAN